MYDFFKLINDANLAYICYTIYTTIHLYSAIGIIMEIEINFNDVKKCPQTFVLAVNDTMTVLTGKWKLPIIASLVFGKKRFKDIEREIPKITPKMLSKELRELELNGIVKRSVLDTYPVVIEYQITESGRNIKMVLDAMVKWGIEHRKKTFESV